MGREIRMVPPGWEHPRYTTENVERYNLIGQFHPLFDHDFEEPAKDWVENCILWMKGEHPDQKDGECSEYPFYWQWAGNPPDYEYYRPKWKDGEATHFQVYETVSEGTPVSPSFTTREQLVEYLATNGDFWDQRRGDGPWDRESAAQFAGCGWAPSGIGISGQGIKTVKEAGFYPSK